VEFNESGSMKTMNRIVAIHGMKLNAIDGMQ
jgi:hypothetical protein